MALKPQLLFLDFFRIALMAKGSTEKYKPRFKDPEAIELIAKNVRFYRNQKGISMEDVADLIGIEYSVISRLELQKSNPSISVVYAIAKVLEIEPYLLFMK
ncbi:helix-turn-helix domain-containing protein [Mucilaginibacter sp. X4EP1]|uniref:helix-turn-helix domain-containing protein n=1 Tax=Mucilaginibacter sp. X4EP1 TaxID=2723092 RepID=UPI00216A0136|nr:helix-turn-helix transcriptional regulator [Mucilaginibacter sp. X4EP1]MCS3814383.1 ribosome-binding protein aMBF1 (putative translation factor) [Mucilaginibacter sp. X4EP1]